MKDLSHSISRTPPPPANIITYLYHALPLTVILSHPGLKDWHVDKYLNICQFIVPPQRRLHLQEGLNYDDYVVDYTAREHVYSKILNIAGLPEFIEPQSDNISDFIKNAICEDAFVIIRLDYSWLPGLKEHYNYKFVHEILIWDFDREFRHFVSCTYSQHTNSHVFRWTELDIANAYRAGLDQIKSGFYQKPSAGLSQHLIKIVRFKDFSGVYIPSKENILTQLSNYARSTDNYDDIYAASDWYTDIAQASYGAKATRRIAENLCEFGFRRGPRIVGVDYRHIGLLHEHKQRVLAAVGFVLGTDSEAYSQYAEVCEEIGLLKMYYYAIHFLDEIIDGMDVRKIGDAILINLDSELRVLAHVLSSQA